MKKVMVIAAVYFLIVAGSSSAFAFTDDIIASRIAERDNAVNGLIRHYLLKGEEGRREAQGLIVHIINIDVGLGNMFLDNHEERMKNCLLCGLEEKWDVRTLPRVLLEKRINLAPESVFKNQKFFLLRGK